MASKTYYVGWNGLIRRLDNLNFDPNGNTYTNWVDLQPYFGQSFNTQSLWDVMTIPGNKNKVFVVGIVQAGNVPWKGIAYSTTAGQNTTNPSASFISPGFPGGAIPSLITDYVYATEGYYSFYEVWCVNATTIYACGDGGAVIRSIDGGLNFTLHAVPNSIFYPPYNTGTFPAPITSIHFESNDNGVVGSINQVFLTTTGSTTCTWVSAAATPANTGFIRGIYKKGNLIVAVGTNKIICSTDGGATWITQVTWSEPPSQQSSPRNGEHLTWHYDACNNITYFRATGKYNEIYQTAYKVNSFVDPVTNVALTPATAWSIFNNHLFNPTSVTPTNPANNYFAAHFYKPFEGFLGRTLAESAGLYKTGYRKVDQYVSNTEILDVDITPPNPKNYLLSAIWTDIDPTVYYKIQQCDGQKTFYVEEGTNTANVASLVNQTVNNISIYGTLSPYCWTVTGPITCGTYQTSDVNTLSAQILSGCTDELCNNCYKLQNCQDPDDYIIVTPVPALQDAIYQSVTLPDFCPGKCWYVIPDWPCDSPQALPEDIVVTTYKNCNDCLGVVETYDLRPRSVKPGFYTPGCPPEYTVKTSCMYSEQVYDEMVSIRYGVNICCDHDVDRWDIKKQLLELNALYNPELCTATPIVCKEVCNLTATLSISGPIQPYEETAPICKPPRFPNVDLRQALLCFRFDLRDYFPTYTYITTIYIGDREINLAGLVTDPIQSSMFSIQFVAAMESLGLQCAGTFYDSDVLTIYGFNANVVSIVAESPFEEGTVTEVVFPLIVECSELPSYNCYYARFELGSFFNGNINTITIYNGTSEITYDVAYLNINVFGSGPVPALVTYLQSQGYGLDSASVTVSIFGRYLYLSNFTGGIPMAVYPVLPGLPFPAFPGYFFRPVELCP